LIYLSVFLPPLGTNHHTTTTLERWQEADRPFLSQVRRLFKKPDRRHRVERPIEHGPSGSSTSRSRRLPSSCDGRQVKEADVPVASTHSRRSHLVMAAAPASISESMAPQRPAQEAHREVRILSASGPGRFRGRPLVSAPARSDSAWRWLSSPETGAHRRPLRGPAAEVPRR